MRPARKYRPPGARLGQYLFVIRVLAFFVPGQSVFAQFEEEITEEGRPVAHVHKPGGTCCLHCIRTWADENPDVATRPCFGKHLRILGYLPAGIPFYAPAPPNVVGGDKVSSNLKTLLEEKWKRVIREELQPPDNDAVIWQSVAFSGLPHQNPLAAKWDSNGRQIVVNGGGGHPSLRVTLRFAGDQRVEFTVPDESELASATPLNWKQSHIDKTKLHKILTKYFQFPFQDDADFVVRPNGKTVDGVRIFSANILSKESWIGTPENQRSDVSKRQWFDNTRILITDSDPQYFFLMVTFPDLIRRP